MSQSSDSRIPILDLRPEIDSLWGELNEAIQRVLKSTSFIQGPDVKAFEEEAQAYLKTKHAIGMNSGTDALVIGLRALGVGPGDEVIVPAFTFFATAECVSLLGAKPVIVDVDPETFNLTGPLVEAAVTTKTKAVIPVHLFGHAAPMDEIRAVAGKHKLKILEDVAQAFSGLYNGKKLGTLGDAAAYSFFPSKNLGAYGDGGMLTTDDDKIAETARMLRVHGAKKKYFNEVVGYNSRLDTLQAAILRVKLPRLDAATEGRRAAAARYRELLSSVKGVVAPVEKSWTTHAYHQYTVRLERGDRDQVQQKMSAAGVETMLYYPKPLHKLPVYESLGLKLPVSERLAKEVLSLPIWPQIDGKTQGRVVETLAKALG